MFFNVTVRYRYTPPFIKFMMLGSRTSLFPILVAHIRIDTRYKFMHWHRVLSASTEAHIDRGR